MPNIANWLNSRPDTILWRCSSQPKQQRLSLEQLLQLQQSAWCEQLTPVNMWTISDQIYRIYQIQILDFNIATQASPVETHLNKIFISLPFVRKQNVSTKYASSLRDISFNRSPLCLHSAFLKELLVHWFHLSYECKNIPITILSLYVSSDESLNFDTMKWSAEAVETSAAIVYIVLL